MKILGTQYSIPTHSYEIFLSGCNRNPKCDGCFSPNSWDFNEGEELTTYVKEKIYSEIIDAYNLIHNIFILGGEPLNQNKHELTNLLIILDSLGLPLWLFTSYEFYEIDDDIKPYFDYIKTGRFDKNLPKVEIKTPDTNIILASNNQRIWKRDSDGWEEIIAE